MDNPHTLDLADAAKRTVEAYKILSDYMRELQKINQEAYSEMLSLISADLNRD